MSTAVITEMLVHAIEGLLAYQTTSSTNGKPSLPLDNVDHAREELIRRIGRFYNSLEILPSASLQPRSSPRLDYEVSFAIPGVRNVETLSSGSFNRDDKTYRAFEGMPSGLFETRNESQIQ